MFHTALAIATMLTVVAIAALSLRSRLAYDADHPAEPDPGRPLVAYQTLRKVVGVLGILLPVIVVVWGFFVFGRIELQSSISSYYALRTRDAFVGILFVLGWFLFAYKGHDETDDLAGDFAFAFALCVAIFPNSGAPWEQVIHFGSAVALFGIFAFFCLCLFTRTDQDPMPPAKLRRNRIYRRCGWLIVVCLGILGLSFALMSPEARDETKIVLVFETIMLWAFGWSWIVKGEMVYGDE